MNNWLKNKRELTKGQLKSFKEIWDYLDTNIVFPSKVDELIQGIFEEHTEFFMIILWTLPSWLLRARWGRINMNVYKKYVKGDWFKKVFEILKKNCPTSYSIYFKPIIESLFLREELLAYELSLLSTLRQLYYLEELFEIDYHELCMLREIVFEYSANWELSDEWKELYKLYFESRNKFRIVETIDDGLPTEEQMKNLILKVKERLAKLKDEYLKCVNIACESVFWQFIDWQSSKEHSPSDEEKIVIQYRWLKSVIPLLLKKLQNLWKEKKEELISKIKQA